MGLSNGKAGVKRIVDHQCMHSKNESRRYASENHAPAGDVSRTNITRAIFLLMHIHCGTTWQSALIYAHTEAIQVN